ncbi:hypothetical protein BAUCODRAFT_147394 [Baudoinia panamericana UAMH 10762]|uniref:Uncharacterized protein n=1 Tax=Baudoinia panamericana (strain UAMH 10762) TaxID=717646 RepID=M2MKQ1_BAUPA|nr:uncharacterized protein BAUCODRAFT_147394 [Baudoinia panamericana UAMH 10762]EMC97271.1 hypothetical protein BAUCODRAFT_147394 [Baudoinia panamericana UAMH 10762]
MKRLKILPYDFSTKFNTQLVSISKGRQTVLWARCKTEDFIRKAMPTKTMATQGIPAVFSFSLSYHIQTISMLKTKGVPMFGCGFVHDSMTGTVGRDPVTMRIKDKTKGPNSEVVSTFGKSTYVEPFTKMCAVPGLVLVKDAMPDLWEKVDTNTIEIMDRAVIMCSAENTSRYTVDQRIWTCLESGFGSGQSQLITILLQPEQRVTLHLSSLSTASRTHEGRFCIIIEISSPSDNLGVPCLHNLVLNMVVHESISRSIHALCITCKDTNTNPIEDQHTSQYENFNLDENISDTPSLTYSSDLYESEPEDLFYDAGPKPIQDESQDMYEDYNTCATKGEDLG